MLSENHKIFIAFGLAVTILKRNGGRAKLTEKRFPPSGVARSYEEEIHEVSRNLSESEVQLNFPMALEILLDFTFFDVDEGATVMTHTPSVLISGLNKICTERGCQRLEKFSEHLSKRLFQRTVGSSDAMSLRGEFVVSILCGVRDSDRSSKTASSIPNSQNSDPPLYARWILEAVDRVIRKIAESGLDIMRNPFGDQKLLHDYRIYERLVALSVILKDGIMMLVQRTNSSAIYFNRALQANSHLANVASSSCDRVRCNLNGKENGNKNESNISFARSGSAINRDKNNNNSMSHKIRRQNSGDNINCDGIQNENGKRDRNHSNSACNDRHGYEKQRKCVDRYEFDDLKGWSSSKSQFMNAKDDSSSDDSQELLSREKERGRERYSERENGRERERGRQRERFDNDNGGRGYTSSKSEINQGNEREEGVEEEEEEDDEECSVEVWAMSMIGEKQT